jgi:hypothetical protein
MSSAKDIREMTWRASHMIRQMREIVSLFFESGLDSFLHVKVLEDRNRLQCS